MCPEVQGLYYLTPFENPEVFDRYIEGLKKAGYSHYVDGMIKKGYKGNPLNYYKIRKENKMTGQEIQNLLFGKIMTGYFFGMPWSRIIYKNGEFEHTDVEGVSKGKMWIKDDEVYSKYESRYNGLRDYCEIYRNPEGDNKTLSEYIFLTDFWMFPISIVE